jgi:hypothetical protein
MSAGHYPLQLLQRDPIALFVFSPSIKLRVLTTWYENLGFVFLLLSALHLLRHHPCTTMFIKNAIKLAKLDDLSTQITNLIVIMNEVLVRITNNTS